MGLALVDDVVVAGAAIEDLAMAGAAVADFRGPAVAQRVIAVTAMDRVAMIAGPNDVIAVNAVDQVRPTMGDDRIFTRAAVNFLGAVAAGDGVAPSPPDSVSAATPPLITSSPLPP